MSPKLTPAGLMTRINRCVDKSKQINDGIPKPDKSVREKDFPDAQARHIHQQFVEIFHEIDLFLKDEDLSPPQRQRLLHRAAKNTNSLVFMMSRLSDRALERSELVFNLTNQLMELSVQPGFDAATQQKIRGWLVESSNHLAFRSITELDSRFGGDALDLLERVSSSISRFKLRHPDKVSYNLYYSLAVRQLREGQYDRAKLSLKKACGYHNQKRLHEFLSVTAALESHTCSKVPSLSLVDIPPQKPASFTLHVQDNMPIENLLDIACKAIQFCREQLLLRQQLITAQFQNNIAFNELNSNAHAFQYEATGALAVASKALFPLCVQRQIATVKVARLIADLKHALTSIPANSKGIEPIQSSIAVIEVHLGTTVCQRIYNAVEQLLKESENQQSQYHDEIQQLLEILEKASIPLDNLPQNQKIMLQSMMSKVAEKKGDDQVWIDWLQRWRWTPDSKEEAGRINQIRRFYKLRCRNEEAIAFEKEIQAGHKSQLDESLKRMVEIYYHTEKYDAAMDILSTLRQSQPLFYHCQMALLLQNTNNLRGAWQHLKLAGEHVNDLSGFEHRDGRYLYHKRVAFFHNFLARCQELPAEFGKVSTEELKRKALKHAQIAKDNVEQQNKDLDNLILRLTDWFRIGGSSAERAGRS